MFFPSIQQLIHVLNLITIQTSKVFTSNKILDKRTNYTVQCDTPKISLSSGTSQQYNTTSQTNFWNQIPCVVSYDPSF